VAEGNGLLNRHTAKSGIGGSNPPLSANFLRRFRPTRREVPLGTSAHSVPPSSRQP
jgi:hypothetical protein